MLNNNKDDDNLENKSENEYKEPENKKIKTIYLILI